MNNNVNINIGISIIICCYNSKKVLPKTFEHIYNQDLPIKIKWELIIVDNNSSDDTYVYSEEYWENNSKKIDYKIVKESNPGLMHARKKGINQAKYEYLIFCDDDNWLCKDYSYNAFNIIHNNPNIGVAGGQGEAVCEIEKPDWFDKKQNHYACGKQASKTGIINDRGYLWGAGFITKKSIFYRIHEEKFTTYLLGRKGNSLGAGDDSEICKWILLLGFDLYYDESLKFKHFITKKRLTLNYYNKMALGFKASHPFLNKYDYLIFLKKLNKSKFLKFLIIIKILIFNDDFNITNIKDLLFFKKYFKYL